MRIWSLHPSLLDRRALIACWRETLLAQKVLQGRTRGYVNHSQLLRLKAHPQPLRAIGAYLWGLADEAQARGYAFNRALIAEPPGAGALPPIAVTSGQLACELAFLTSKVARRDAAWLPALAGRAAALAAAGQEAAHPLFAVVAGDIEPWEKSARPHAPGAAGGRQEAA